MRQFLVAGVLAGLSTAAPFTLAEASADSSETRLVPRAVTARTMKDYLQRFGATSPERLIKHAPGVLTRVTRVGAREVLEQVSERNHDVSRYALPLGLVNDGFETRLELPTTRSTVPALTHWVTVVRTRGAVQERRTLAFAERGVFNWVTKSQVDRPVPLQRSFERREGSEFLRVDRVKHGNSEALLVQAGGAVGRFVAAGLVTGSILTFEATADRLTVTTSTQVQYEFGVARIGDELQFTQHAGVARDVADQLKVEHQFTPHDTIMVKEPCETTLAKDAR